MVDVPCHAHRFRVTLRSDQHPPTLRERSCFETKAESAQVITPPRGTRPLPTEAHCCLETVTAEAGAVVNDLDYRRTVVPVREYVYPRRAST
ncbi:hypothetical protein GCM10027188_08200 [Lysobacter humi (ex Lee et al. 2017)]